MGTQEIGQSIGGDSGQDMQDERKKREKYATRQCLRTLTFVQLWLGSVLLIVGIALTSSYGLLFLAILIDGIITVGSSAFGAASVYYVENRCLYCLRRTFTIFQIFYGIPLVFMYIWAAVEYHIAFTAFVIIEAIQVVLAVFIVLIYTNRYHISSYCFSSEVEEEVPSTRAAQPTRGGGNTVIVNHNTNIPPAYNANSDENRDIENAYYGNSSGTSSSAVYEYVSNERKTVPPNEPPPTYDQVIL